MPLYRRKPKGSWHAEYTDHAGNRIRKSTGTADKSAAQRILDQWQLDALNVRHGVTTTQYTLDELVRQYIAYLASTGDVHQQKTEHRIRRIVDAADWTKPGQITQYQVETIARALTNERNGQPLSLHTQSHYLTAIKMFTAWLTKTRHAIARDPLAGLKKPNWKTDQRITRRFLLPDEWQWLRLTPHALLYETAIQTGYRASELAKLTPTNLRDDHLYLPPKHTKNKQAAMQYITDGLRHRLSTSLPFDVDISRAAELLRLDLGIARWYASNDLATIDQDQLQPLDSRGHVLDFHSLRHTCGAWLAIAGVSPKVIQSVMRHSSIVLTLDTYGHLMPGAERDAIQHFDRILGRA